MKASITCRQGVRLLMGYAEGTLAAPLRGVIDAHVGGCVRCQKFVRSYAETPRILRGATDARLPAHLARRLRRRVAALAAGAVGPARRSPGGRRGPVR